ncbi:MAG: family 20 glycosylhydrolase [Labilithrix sp.]|nr:family 20 glycosylhydrolase [Labilithrix sp.]MCW5810502.1 family 20 glycosylhydrolase [Labilithrix sp.]
MPRHLRLALLAGITLAIACGHTPSATPRPAIEEPSLELPLLPRARRDYARCGEPFVIDAHTRIGGPREVASQLARWLGLPESAVGGGAADIDLVYTGGVVHDPAEGPLPIDEQSYVLEIGPGRKPTVSARGRGGLFYGAQTIAQLAGARRIGMPTPPLGPGDRWTLPCVRIEDEPRHAFRGMHLDVARHFFDRAVVERYVDMLAFYKLNVFHWHLTDDQGFRLDLPSHPELKSADGAYSAADVEAVVEHARARGVTVIPEIEMPGHTRSVLAAHPELSCTGEKQETPRTWGVFDDVLCAGNEGSYTLVEEMLRDVVAAFPSRLIHVGGDEVPPTRWEACPKCRAAMKAANVDAIGLEHVFMQRVFDMLAASKRRPMVWDEALPNGPARNPPVVVAWQSKERGELAVQRGFDTVFAPYQALYFNFRQSGRRELEPGHLGHLSWPLVHGFDVEPAPHVLGGEAALWTEYVTTQEDIDTLVLPRMAVHAETLWTGRRPAHELITRSRLQRPMLDASGVRYFVEPPGGTRPRSVVLDVRKVVLETPLFYPDGVVRYTRDGSIPTPASPRYRDPLSIIDTTTLTTALFLPSGRASKPVRALFVKETPRPAVATASAPRVRYYEGRFAKLAEIASPLAEVETDGVSLEAAARALGGRMKRDHFALVFDAVVKIAETGIHRFEIVGDDAARIEVDGELVAEVDTDPWPREADGEIALAAGLHAVRVTYLQGTEDRKLEIVVAGPSGRAPLEIAGVRGASAP